MYLSKRNRQDRNLPRTAASEKVLHHKAFIVANNPKYDGRKN